MLTILTPGALSEGDEGVAVLEVFYCVLDHLDLTGAGDPTDGDVLGETHGPADEGDSGGRTREGGREGGRGGGGGSGNGGVKSREIWVSF